MQTRNIFNLLKKEMEMIKLHNNMDYKMGDKNEQLMMIQRIINNGTLIGLIMVALLLSF
jgi:hypothetical protein